MSKVKNILAFIFVFFVAFCTCCFYHISVCLSFPSNAQLAVTLSMVITQGKTRNFYVDMGSFCKRQESQSFFSFSRFPQLDNKPQASKLELRCWYPSALHMETDSVQRNITFSSLPPLNSPCMSALALYFPRCSKPFCVCPQSQLRRGHIALAANGRTKRHLTDSSGKKIRKK